jgi:hypothetical protein
MSESAFCYHCRQMHPVTEMKQVRHGTMLRWRCLRSIEAARSNRHQRDAWGRQTTERNRREAAAQARTQRALRTLVPA